VIDRSAGTVTLPPGGRFDPGGIGKGLAADLVAAELAADRAGELAAADPAGVCVNVGGDVRVHGVGPHPDGWQIGLPDGRVVALRDAAVASSGTDRRAWRVAGARRHHVIDPATGRCAATSLRSTAVVAPVAWLADAHALAALVTGVRPALAALRAAGLDGILVDHDGVVHTTGRLGVGV
jgi:thiamine biosynthesis lipoprotein